MPLRDLERVRRLDWSAYVVRQVHRLAPDLNRSAVGVATVYRAIDLRIRRGTDVTTPRWTRMRTSKISITIFCSAIVLGQAGGRAWGEIHIAEARYEAGVLTVRGDSDQPNTTVTLDRMYKEQTGDTGEFLFRVRYKPRACMADIRINNEIFSAVVANCLEPGNAGTPGRNLAR